MFNREFVSASSAVGLGALIGGLLSTEIATCFSLGNMLWIFGALFGGMVSYVVVEFKQFCEGVSDAFKKTVTWRPNMLYWKTVTVWFFGLWSALSSVAIFQFALLDYTSDAGIPFLKMGTISTIIAAVLGVVISIPVCNSSMIKGRRNVRYMLGLQKHGFWLLTRLNPISAPFTALFYLVKAITSAVRAVPKIFTEVKEFGAILGPVLVVVLKELHSQKRAMVFFDAVAGAAVGYLIGNALIGAIIGAVVLYPIHHKLVAVRLLKVVPQ